MPTKRQRRKRRRRQSGAQPAARRPSAVVLDDQQRARADRQRAGREERPQPLWGSFPLSEIVIFVGVLLLFAGLFVQPPRGLVMIGVGGGLASLAGLELALREHYTGYRSHTLLLAAGIGVPVLGVLLLATKLPTVVCVIAAVVAFGGSAWLFAQAFQRRSGGALFRLRG
jgi:Flp pilus assembly protein TadB